MVVLNALPSDAICTVLGPQSKTERSSYRFDIKVTESNAVNVSTYVFGRCTAEGFDRVWGCYTFEMKPITPTLVRFIPRWRRFSSLQKARRRRR